MRGRPHLFVDRSCVLLVAVGITESLALVFVLSKEAAKCYCILDSDSQNGWCDRTVTSQSPKCLIYGFILLQYAVTRSFNLHLSKSIIIILLNLLHSMVNKMFFTMINSAAALSILGFVRVAIAADVHGSSAQGTMGPVAFLWPTDRTWSADTDNVGPCGSNVGVTNRTVFPFGCMPFVYSRFNTVTNNVGSHRLHRAHNCRRCLRYGSPHCIWE